MANRFKRKEVLEALLKLMSNVVQEVYTTVRPTVKETSKNWAVVSLPYGINASTSTLNYAHARIQLFYKDRENGIENVNAGEELIDKTIEAMDRDLSVGGRFAHLMTCNDQPRVLYFKSDHMGYHSVVIQFKLIISFINN